MPNQEDIAQARNLLKRYARHLSLAEREQLETLLDRIERGAVSRAEVLRALAAPLRSRGLTYEEAMAYLRRTPYYRLVMSLLPES